jgi:phosphoribosyl 1,2-cyclic phosphodiesterase
MRLITHGCRGSIPNPSKEMQKYGGNTTCFELQFDRFQIFFDTGSGFQNASLESSKEILILFSHFHHDHIQGLAFNKYLLAPRIKTSISSALVNSENLNKIVRDYFSGAYFPLDLFENLKNVTFLDFTATQKRLGEHFRIEAIKLAHPGGSFGYSVQTDNKKFVFLGDNEFTTSQSEELKKFIEKADIVIWDGMFTKKELQSKGGWGHSSIEQGIDFLSNVNCGEIIISHHAPYRTDSELDKINQSLPHGFHLAKDGHVLEL